MTPTGYPPWAARGSGPRRSSRYSTLGLRVSDAERAEVADRLSKHYADGRLDQVEFTERLDQAMAAKTQADLVGLFTDLPSVDGSGVATQRRHDGHPHHHRLLLLVLLIVVLASVGQIVVHLWHPWLLLGLFIAAWLLRHDLVRHRR